MNHTIMTLDGKFWQYDEILKEMDSDEFYYGYLGKYALSSSSVKTLLDSPKAYLKSLRQRSDTPALLQGRLVHLAVLEPHKFDKLNFVDVQSRNTKAFKEALSENSESYTIKEHDLAMYMAQAIHDNKYARELLEGTDKEVPSMNMMFGKPFRGKADALGSGRMVDLKTTSSDVNEFHWSAKKFKYMCQAYIYSKLFDVDYKDIYYLAINKETYDIGIFDVSQEFYNLGESLVERAVQVYTDEIENGMNELHNYTIRGTL